MTRTVSVVQKVLGAVNTLLFNPQYYWHLAALLIFGDVVLTQLIIRFVPFTEIDFETYIEHISLYDAGERDYSLITGASGALVYPAGHVVIHKWLRHVTALAPGDVNLRLAQQIYGGLYIASQLVICFIYRTSGSVPNYAIIPLVLSKRLHSIMVLRLFNDCWAVAFMLVAVAFFQKRRFVFGSAFFSFALSVKMNILLYVPGLLVILVANVGVLQTLGHAILIAAIQTIVAIPFLSTYPASYLRNAFDLSRVFLYRWTVNWRFIPEETFLSPEFARSLLVAHVLSLALFGYKWCLSDGGIGQSVRRAIRKPFEPAGLVPMHPDRIATILFTSNLIGVLFARSLHYQFYSWYAQHLPFLLFHTNFPVAVKFLILGFIEYAWNVYPSTNVSSGILLAFNVTIVVAVWFGYPNGRRRSAAS